MKQASGAVALTTLMLGIALAAPLISSGPTLETAEVALRRFTPPLSSDGAGDFHILGTDSYGRDVMGRIAYGARVSLGVAGVSVVLALFVGVIAGVVSGLGPAWMDRSIVALIDGMLAMPRLVLLLLLVSIWEGSILLVVLAIGLTGWMGIARLVRSEVKTLRTLPFVAAARSSGRSESSIALIHIVPNALGPALIAASLSVGNAIALEAGLSFLGLGVPPNIPSWGNMIASGRDALVNAPWIATIPGLLVATAVIAANLASEALQRRINPPDRRAV